VPHLDAAHKMTINWDCLVKYGTVLNMVGGNGRASEPFRRTIYGHEMTTGANAADAVKGEMVHLGR
jgi:hypothetical protein